MQAQNLGKIKQNLGKIKWISYGLNVIFVINLNCKWKKKSEEKNINSERKNIIIIWTMLMTKITSQMSTSRNKHGQAKTYKNIA